jgi:hypothetical protein
MQFRLEPVRSSFHWARLADWFCKQPAAVVLARPGCQDGESVRLNGHSIAERMRRRALPSLVALAISGGILWWLLSSPEGGHGLMTLLAQANIWPLLLAFLLVPVIQGLRAWRFSILLFGRTAAPSWPMFVVAVRLILFNFLLPFKLGEATFPVMTQRAFGTAISHSVGALALVRLLDFGVVAALLLLAAAMALPEHAPVPQELLMTGGLLLVVSTLLLPSLLGVLRQAARRLGWQLVDRVLESAATLEETTPRLLVMLSTLTIWIAQALVGWLAAIAAFQGIGLAATTFAAASANLAFALPVPTIAGLGPPQAAWVMALDLTAIPWAAAVATALTCHAVQFTGALMLGFVTWLAPIRLQPSTIHPTGAC